LFVGLEAGIGTGSSTLDARRKASLGSRKAGSLQASMTSIDTGIDNLKQKLHFRHFEFLLELNDGEQEP